MTGRGVLNVFIQRPRHFERESLRQIAQMSTCFLWDLAVRCAAGSRWPFYQLGMDIAETAARFMERNKSRGVMRQTFAEGLRRGEPAASKAAAISSEQNPRCESRQLRSGAMPPMAEKS